MSTATLTRPPRAYTTAKPQRASAYEASEDGSLTRLRKRRRAAKKDPPPLVQKVALAAQVYGIQGVMETMLWFQGWREYFYPPGAGWGPNIVKAYEVRPRMGVRIFFPSSYDLTSPQTLPTILSIHGGGFCTGTARDDEMWNRAFADSQGMLVISLPYSKAPRAPFPGALYDLEALYLAVLGDESLPIDRTSSRRTGRVALLGFDAGANLALGLGQLPQVKRSATAPTAVVSISGYLDLERPVAHKLANRPYKPTLPFPRNSQTDALAAAYEAYVWGYVPYGHDLRDPLLSPAFASCGDDGGLPSHVCLVGAELDVLAHESWRMACRLVRAMGVSKGDGRRASWRVPDPDEDDVLERVCGRAPASESRGQYEMSELARDDEGVEAKDGVDESKRFGFEERWKDGEGSVKWILVPDALHGFDRGVVMSAAGEEAKMRAYISDVGRWLRSTVWSM